MPYPPHELNLMRLMESGKLKYKVLEQQTDKYLWMTYSGSTLKVLESLFCFTYDLLESNFSILTLCL